MKSGRHRPWHTAINKTCIAKPSQHLWRNGGGADRVPRLWHTSQSASRKDLSCSTHSRRVPSGRERRKRVVKSRNRFLVRLLLGLPLLQTSSCSGSDTSVKRDQDKWRNELSPIPSYSTPVLSSTLLRSRTASSEPGSGPARLHLINSSHPSSYRSPNPLSGPK